MCYGKPGELLKSFLEANPLEKDDRGYTLEDDWEHFCAYSGMDPATCGWEAFEWAHYAFISAGYQK